MVSFCKSSLPAGDILLGNSDDEMTNHFQFCIEFEYEKTLFANILSYNFLDSLAVLAEIKLKVCFNYCFSSSLEKTGVAYCLHGFPASVSKYKNSLSMLLYLVPRRLNADTASRLSIGQSVCMRQLNSLDNWIYPSHARIDSSNMPPTCMAFKWRSFNFGTDCR